VFSGPDHKTIDTVLVILDQPLNTVYIQGLIDSGFLFLRAGKTMK
jgi:hypothetical protein